MHKIMRHWETINARKSLWLILLTPLLAGCPKPAAYREPITRFQQASTVVIESARIEYGLTNKRERDALIDGLVAKRAKIISGTPTTKRSGYLVAMIWPPEWRRSMLWPSMVNCYSFSQAVMLLLELKMLQIHLTMRLWASDRHLAMHLLMLSRTKPKVLRPSPVK